MEESKQKRNAHPIGQSAQRKRGGRRRQREQGRKVNGILLLDKPTGESSNASLQTVKQLFDARKAGHTGSLDPLASGMLPLCFGEATKFSQFLLDADKHYQVQVTLGVKTNTGDAEGEVLLEREVPRLTTADLESVLAGFRGPIEQVPSMYSALKHEGKRLYELARQGIEVPRQARTVTIHALTLSDWDGQTNLHLHIHCSKGTYVRTLVEDIGEVLGCGAFVAALRRLTVGPYQEKDMLTMAQLQAVHAKEGVAGLDALLLPLDTAVTSMASVKLTDQMAYFVRSGQPVFVPSAPQTGWVRLLLSDERFLGVGEIVDDGKVAPRRLVSRSEYATIA